MKELTCEEFQIAGFPEGHPGSESPELEMRYLREKVDAGANLIFTQMFYDADGSITFLSLPRALKLTNSLHWCSLHQLGSPSPRRGHHDPHRPWHHAYPDLRVLQASNCLCEDDRTPCAHGDARAGPGGRQEGS